MIEPMFPFKSAIEQIPMRNIQELYNFLNKHPEIEPVYSRTRNTKSPRWGHEEGFLTESQIKEIRRLRFHSFEESRFAKGGRPRGSSAKALQQKRDDLIAWITRSANG